jgi:fatty acid desaturase
VSEDPQNRSPGFRRSRLAWLVTAACALALFGLGVTIVHFLWPTPLMFALFMTVGQGSFGLAMAIYVFVIFADLRRRRVL